MNQRLTRFLAKHNAVSQLRNVSRSILAEEQSHSCWMPRPNLYVEHDIGTKNIRYPDGRLRSVKARKVKDTAGRGFYVFDDNTPLS